MSHAPADAYLHVPGPLTISAGPDEVVLSPLTVSAGEWVLLRPSHDARGADPSVAIARVLCALEPPHGGRLSLFGGDVTRLGYSGLAALRKLLALVPGTGGLLSNRTLGDNVALPISVHRALSHAEEAAVVAAVLARFELTEAQALHPHQVTGATRHRACVARATTLSPRLYVVEGTGEFVGEHHAGLSWARLVEERDAHGAALVACVARVDEDFERWFAAQGGRLCTYRFRADMRREGGSPPP
jgi:ABC-type ATPase involved in cell division